MSSQFSTFAELFDEAIRQGLPTVQTQHPGYHFQLAANHASLRQSACKELCQHITSYPDPDPLLGEEKLKFYGQRPWRRGKLSAEPADTVQEAIGMHALQYREKTMIIIGLLGNAISQFKVYHCPRLLVVQMAEEEFNARDYGKVLILLMHMLWEYHGERWAVLLTDILRNVLRAAYLSTSIQDYLTLAFEALGPSTTFSAEQQAVIYDNIMNILQKKLPNPEPDLSGDIKHLAMEKWMLELNRRSQIFLQLMTITSFVDLKARIIIWPEFDRLQKDIVESIVLLLGELHLK